MWKRLTMLIAILCFSFILTNNSWAAIGATAKWEVRTTGSTTNGGFYTSGGTDYSQQDAAQYALTGATTAAADAIILHASAAAAMVGNGLYVVSGTNFTAGWYEVISVVAGVSITVDRNCTSAAGALGVINVGGAVNHPNTISAVVVAGNTIYIQNGTYVKVGANTYIWSPSVNNVYWNGYNTSRGDNPTGTNRPLMDGDSDNNGTDDTASIIYCGSSLSANTFKNFQFKNATTAAVTNTGSGGTYCFINVRFFSNVDALQSSATGTHWFLNCEIDTNSDAGTDDGDIHLYLYNCYIHDNTEEGIDNGAGGANMFAVGNISDSNGGNGFGVGGVAVLKNNIAYNNTGAATDGFELDTDNRNLIYNNSSTSNGLYGFNMDSSGNSYFDYNNYNGNATAGLNNITAGANDTTAAPTFTAATTGDFTLTSADTALLNKGTPDANWAASVGLTAGDYQWNIGVDQDDNTAAGAGGGRGARFINN